MGWKMARIKAPVAEKVSAKLAKKPGMHAMGDPPGLYLAVEGGAKSWILRYSLNGRRRDLGLGSYADFTLAEARERARERRKLVADGLDPIELKRERREAAVLDTMTRKSFGDCLTAYLKAHSSGWRNPKHRAQWRTSVETHAKALLPLNVAAITVEHVHHVLDPIWKEKTETASRVRGRIEKVLDWATVRRYRTGENPARWKGNLSELFPAPGRVTPVEHHPALPYRDMGAFMVDLREQDGIGARALEFAILTAMRSGEVRGATWDEIDLAHREWTIPASRMKAQKEHRVPLTDASVAILEKMDKHKMSDGIVFPGAKEGKPLSDMALTAVLRRMKREDIVPHGFRSTFRDWAAETTSYPNHVVEMALAHTIGDKVEASYRRGDLYEKRKRLMADWARYCAKVQDTTGNVVPMKGRKHG
jgi:integrase